MRALASALLTVGLCFTPSAPQAQERSVTVKRAPNSRYPEYAHEASMIIARRMVKTFYLTPTGGVAVVRLIVERSGNVAHASVTTSSGSDYIDRVALRAVPVGLQLPPIPAGRPAPIDVYVPLRFGRRLY